jgi:hypothetical protein
MKRIYNSPVLQLVLLHSESTLMNGSPKLRVDTSKDKTINSEADINTLGKHEQLWEDE